MKIIELYKSDTNAGILLRLFGNILLIVVFMFFVIQIGKMLEPKNNGSPQTADDLITY